MTRKEIPAEGCWSRELKRKNNPTDEYNRQKVNCFTSINYPVFCLSCKLNLKGTDTLVDLGRVIDS